MRHPVAFLVQESSLEEIDYVTNDDLERLYGAVDLFLLCYTKCQGYANVLMNIKLTCNSVRKSCFTR